MADRIDITQIEVLERFVALLITETGLPAAFCFLTLDPDAINLPQGGDYWLTVSPGDGYFGEGEQFVEQCYEDLRVIVTIWNRITTADPTDVDTGVLTAATGILVNKRTVLMALVGADILTEAGAQGNIRGLVQAKHAGAPKAFENKNVDGFVVRLPVTFGVAFDWDLTD